MALHPTLLPMQTRSKRDAELLYEAKYGKRGSDGKMSREQYAALRRRVGGTAKGKCMAQERGLGTVLRGPCCAPCLLSLGSTEGERGIKLQPIWSRLWDVKQPVMHPHARP